MFFCLKDVLLLNNMFNKCLWLFGIDIKIDYCVYGFWIMFLILFYYEEIKDVKVWDGDVVEL